MGRHRLHGRKATGAAASETALEEAGADRELVEVPGDRGLAAAEGYLLVNPRGQVPVLVLPDGTAIAEGTAILLHLADAFPMARLAPPPGRFERARHDRWECPRLLGLADRVAARRRVAPIHARHFGMPPGTT